jgi:hypothetical protein
MFVQHLAPLGSCDSLTHAYNPLFLSLSLS